MSLNKQQEIAVQTRGSDVFVNSGPGAGKTHVIIARAVSLVKEGVPESKILLITFTNRAADIMRMRLKKMGVDGVHCSTFHSLGYEIMRELIGGFSIVDDDEAKRIIKKISNKKEVDEILSYISERKESMIPARMDKGFYSTEYQAYQQFLSEINAYDFDDLISSAVLLLRDRPGFGRRWDYILVDEVQDTSKSQFYLLDLLRDGRKCTFVVGDQDQSIYTWRGANPDNIKDYITKYSPAVVGMGINYRSSAEIVSASSLLISHDFERIDKELKSSSGKYGVEPFFKVFKSDVQEAEWVAKKAVELSKEGDVQILYRVNWMSSLIEASLMNQHVGYKICNDLSFFNRAEIKDLSAFLRVINNQQDSMALKRVLSGCLQGFGSKTTDRINSVEDLNRMELNSKQSEGRLLLNGLITQFKSSSDTLQVASTVLDATSMLGYEEQGRLENLSQFLRMCQGSDIASFVPKILLKDSLDPLEVSAPIRLMTMHGSKGSESHSVIVMGCEQGIIPHASNGNLNEERRLMYVAMTRAKRRLLLTMATQRYIFGSARYQDVSQFVLEAEIEQST